MSNEFWLGISIVGAVLSLIFLVHIIATRVRFNQKVKAFDQRMKEIRDKNANT